MARLTTTDIHEDTKHHRVRRRRVISSKTRLWRNLKRDYSTKYGVEPDSKRTRGFKGYRPPTLKEIVAKQKLERLKTLTITGKAYENSLEPFRISGYWMLRGYFKDITLYITTTLVYLLAYLISLSLGFIPFLLLLVTSLYFVNQHVDSYRSFVAERKTAELLSRDVDLRKSFLLTRSGRGHREKVYFVNETDIKLKRQRVRNDYDENYRVRHRDISFKPPEPVCDIINDDMIVSTEPVEDLETTSADSFHWLNQIINFFWPYMSHLIHYEVNKFFERQIEAKFWRKSKKNLKKLFLAMARQLDTNILLIERAEIGKESPFVTKIEVTETLITKTQQAFAETKQDLKVDEQTTKVVAKTTKTVNTESVMIKSQTPKSSKSKKVTTHKTEKSKKFKYLVINFKIQYDGDMQLRVMYKYLFCMLSHLGLRDVYLGVNMRFVLGPLLSKPPYVERIEFCLLELPDFGYKGIAMAELFELRVVKRAINRAITDNILYPKSISIDVGSLIEALLNKNMDTPQNPPNSRDENYDPTKEGKVESAASVASSMELEEQKEGSCWTRCFSKTILCSVDCINYCCFCCRRRRKKILETYNKKRNG